MAQLPIPQNPTPIASPFMGFTITPSDSDLLSNATTHLYVGGTGDLTVVLNGDTTAVLLKSVPVGLYALSIAQVKATGTTATELVGLI